MIMFGRQKGQQPRWVQMDSESVVAIVILALVALVISLPILDEWRDRSRPRRRR
jgi:hypothetical protein